MKQTSRARPSRLRLAATGSLQAAIRASPPITNVRPTKSAARWNRRATSAPSRSPSLAAQEFPDTFPLVQAYGCAVIKSLPGNHGEHSLQLKLINTVGEISNLGEFKNRIDGTIVSAPGGATINVQLNVVAKRFGTCYLCL